MCFFFRWRALRRLSQGGAPHGARWRQRAPARAAAHCVRGGGGAGAHNAQGGARRVRSRESLA